jgi:hypothetical protein
MTSITVNIAAKVEDNAEGWGPLATKPDIITSAPFLPYSKGERLGRIAEFGYSGMNKYGRQGGHYNRGMWALRRRGGRGLGNTRVRLDCVVRVRRFFSSGSSSSFSRGRLFCMPYGWMDG